MTEETIFDQVTPEEEQVPEVVAELVGVDKKYKSVEDALKSIPHAQSHIQKLEEEAAQLREELAKRKAAEELLEDFKATRMQEVTPQATLDSETLVKAVEGVLSQREVKQRAQQNIESVVAIFNTQFGEKGPEMYKKVAEESGLPLASLNNLAASSPAAVLKLAGITQVSQTPGKTTSSVNTEAFKPQPTSGNIRVKPVGASTKDLVAAWKAAGEAINH